MEGGKEGNGERSRESFAKSNLVLNAQQNRPNAKFDKLAFFVGGVVRLLTLLPSFFHADACLAKHPIRL